MEIVSNIALISINETVIAQLLSFLIFVFVINRVMFRPLRRTMDERAHFIDRIKDEIDEAKSTLETVTADARKREAAVKKDAFDIRASLEEAAKQDASVLLKAASKQMDGIKADAERDVAEMIEAAKSHVAVEAERLTISIMEKLLDRRLA